MKQADRIRAFVIRKLIEPARAQGRTTLTVKAGDVHSMMGLVNSYAAVCSALRGGKLQSEAGIALKEQEGRANGANVWFQFDLASETLPTGTPAPCPPTRMVSQIDSSISFDWGLVLVSCSKAKLQYPAPARDLYCSPAFQMKRAMIERAGGSWIILSAKHGVVEPTQIIEPYDTTLTTLTVTARREWATGVLPTLTALAQQSGRVISLAGQRYTELLIGPLRAKGVEVIEPLKGLRQGEQLAWLSTHQ